MHPNTSIAMKKNGFIIEMHRDCVKPSEDGLCQLLPETLDCGVQKRFFGISNRKAVTKLQKIRMDAFNSDMRIMAMRQQ